MASTLNHSTIRSLWSTIGSRSEPAESNSNALVNNTSTGEVLAPRSCVDTLMNSRGSAGSRNSKAYREAWMKYHAFDVGRRGGLAPLTPQGVPEFVREFGRQRIAVYAGGSAATYLLQRRALDPIFADAMDASAARLAKRGFRDLRFQTIQVLTVTPNAGTRTIAQRLWQYFVPRASAQEYWAEGGEEPVNGIGIWSSWDDGNDETWEGNAYFENFATGQWYSIDNQLAAESSGPSVLWAETAAMTGRWKEDGQGGCYWDPNDAGPDQCNPPTGRWKDDGQGGCYWDPNDSGPDQCVPRNSLLTTVAERPASLPSFKARHTAALYPVALGRRPSQCGCTGSGRQLPANCILSTAISGSAETGLAAAGACALTGPKYLVCLGVGCGGRIAAGFLVEAFWWGAQCW